MYDLPYHKEKNEQAIKDLIKEYPLAFVSGVDAENRPIATQIPLFFEEIDGKQVLRGHIMKNTDHHKAFLHNSSTLVVFTSKNTYVSGTWYTNPYTPSTWNYMSVHIKGNIRFVNDQELEDILRALSVHFEDHNETATTFDHLPANFKEKALGMIAGFEIEILDIDTVFKLSQDQDEASYQNIIEKLKDQNEDARTIASEMEKRKNDLFSG